MKTVTLYRYRYRAVNGQWIRIQEGKNYSPKIEKKVRYGNFMFLSAGCSLWRAEGFSCSLDVLYGGLGISKLQFFIKRYPIFSNCKFVQYLIIKTLDPVPDWYSA